MMTRFQELMIASISRCLLFGCLTETRRFNLDHKFLMELRSGLFSGHDSTSIPLSDNHFIQIRGTRWHPFSEQAPS